MNILVAVKHAIDYEVDVSINEHGKVETERVSFAMNPFDEVALESAVQLKESGFANKVIAVCIGSADAESTLRTAIASGADEAILVETSGETSDGFEPINLAKILQKIALEHDVQMIITGKQSLDAENAQTGAMLAGLLDFPVLTCVSNITHVDDKLHVTRTTDFGTETFAVTTPVVLTANLSLCQPRFAMLPDIMRAKKAEIMTVQVSELGLTLTATSKSSVREPDARPACDMVDSVEALAEALS